MFSLRYMQSLKSRPGTQRISGLLAAVLLAVLQLVAVGHLIGHSATGDNAGCQVCVNAAHAGSAMVPTVAALPVLQASLGQLPIAAESQVSSLTPAVFRARGPPVSA